MVSSFDRSLELGLTKSVLRQVECKSAEDYY